MKGPSYFSSGQKRGVFLLVVILGAILLALAVRKLYYTPGLPQLADQPPRTQPKKREFFSRSRRTYVPKSYARVELNRADSLDLVQLPGIGPVFSSRIIRYRNSIGGFRSVSDLKSVYGLKPETLERLDTLLYVDTLGTAYRSLQQEQVKQEAQRDTLREQTLDLLGKVAEEPKNTNLDLNKEPLDLNISDSLDLLAVYGIGPKLAARIHKYRQKLGFFHRVEQLQEVWGLSPENYETILPQVTLTDNLRHFPRIPLNTADAETLRNHPYMDGKTARLIVAYRDAHGTFKDKNDLRKMYGVKEEVWEKLEMYLEF